MRLIRIAISLVVLLTGNAFAGSTVMHYDLTSGAQSNTVAFTHRYTVDITVPWMQPGPEGVVIDYLYPTDALGEWGDFQARSQNSNYTTAYPELQPTFQWFSGQWMRVSWGIPPDFEWDFPVDFWVEYNFSGTRTQNASGVSDDFTVSVGAPYTTLTANVFAPQGVYDFADYCEANRISGQVAGHYGTVQRVQGYLHHHYPGNCVSMSMMLAAAMRHINIPSAIAAGYTVPGTYDMPFGFGQFYTFTVPMQTISGHCWVGGWRDDDIFSSLDTNNRKAQLIALQATMIGYFEDPADGHFSYYIFSAGQHTSNSEAVYSNASSNGDQTYSWHRTRMTGETFGNNTYELFTQKVSSTYNGGSGIIGGGDGGQTGVGEGSGKQPTPLGVFVNGRGLYVEIGAPDEGVEASLHLYDVQGRQIQNFGFVDQRIAGQWRSPMQVPDSLRSGVYFARLEFNGQQVDNDRIVILN